MTKSKEYPGHLVFGIDIGTRSLVGTVGYKEKDEFYVVAQKSICHKTRAMLDGQIHDIVKVADTIVEIKKDLELKVERKLNEVCIAAAGRVLKTVTTQIDIELDQEKEITQEDVYELESLGVEKAYEEFLASNTLEEGFFCVGYSIVKYYMNDYPIANLIGHKVKKMSAELIATFLPNDVVDGLYAAVELAGLKVANLTLEPIAAIQVAIPEKYRMLNIALVDVGAGTSDICITKAGSIIAYGMIPCAGDILTETIAQNSLVDFVTADQIKMDANTKSVIEFIDIMSISQSITQEEIMDLLDPLVDSMAMQVADKIIELNGNKSVSAVFIIGGGGKINGYTEKLADYLDLKPERVAVRGEEVLQQITFLDQEIVKDSLIVTPIGICLNFYENNNNFIYTSFNDKKVRLYDNGYLTVVDVAMQMLFPNDGLFAKRGTAINYTMNGIVKIVRGKLGEPAKITVNGEDADLHTPITANDKIIVVESTAGEVAALKIEDLHECNEVMQIIINEKTISLPKYISANNQIQTPYYNIQNGDVIQLLTYYTLRQLIAFADLEINENQAIYVNNQEANLETLIYENFTVKCKYKDAYKRTEKATQIGAKKGTQKEVEQETQIEKDLDSNKNSYSEGEDYEYKYHYEEDDYEDGNFEVDDDLDVEEDDYESDFEEDGFVSDDDIEEDNEADNKEDLSRDSHHNNKMNSSGKESIWEKEQTPLNIEKQTAVMINKTPYVLKGKARYVFVDVFDYIDFDLSAKKGVGIVTTVNGQNAQYLQPLVDGDVIEVYWQ